MQQGTETYIYAVGDADKERLAILNTVYNPVSQQTLLAIGLKDKACILDMACGQGELTCWLAKQAPKATVIGVDISEEQLQLARHLAKTKNLTNVHFISASVLDINPSTLAAHNLPQPDFIYCRWLLVHLEPAKITAAMQSLYNLLRTNGIVLHEEVTLKESYSEPGSLAYDEWIMLFQQLASRLNISFDLGSDLIALLQKMHYHSIQSKKVSPHFTAAQARFFNLDLDCSRKAIYHLQLKTAAEINELQKRIALAIDDGHEFFMPNYQVWGVK